MSYHPPVHLYRCIPTYPQVELQWIFLQRIPMYLLHVEYGGHVEFFHLHYLHISMASHWSLNANLLGIRMTVSRVVQ